VLQSSGSRILGQRINRASLFAGVLGRRRDQEHRPKQNGQKAQEHSAPAPTVGLDHGKGMVFRPAATQIFFPGSKLSAKKSYTYGLFIMQRVRTAGANASVNQKPVDGMRH